MTTHTSSNAAIVTGAARGIGAAIVRRLAGDGLAVIVNYASSAGKAEALAADICAQGGRALAVKADVTVPEQAADLFSACEGAFGTVRVLVNNAGLMRGARPIWLPRRSNRVPYCCSTPIWCPRARRNCCARL